MGSPNGQWEKLTNQERIHLCREYAQEAELLAQAAHADRKTQYKRIAADWHQIAAELDNLALQNQGSRPTSLDAQ